MKLDVNVLRYLERDDFRVLTAVEMGQRNHELVPTPLIDAIANLKRGGALKRLKLLLRHKLVHHEAKKYDGFRLTPLGYDFLAIRTLTARGSIASVGRQIGVGKESDVFEVADSEGNVMCLKLHRLGRTSFRAVKSKRDYLRRGGGGHASWLYLSRLAAMKEVAFMRALGARGLPVPEAIDANRHAVLMTMVDAIPMVQVKTLANPGLVYSSCLGMLRQLATFGLVHCDYNEFNILASIDDEENLTLIDFPQMISAYHANAKELFDRDLECINRFFTKKLGYQPSRDPELQVERPDFEQALAQATDAIDQELRASGFKREHEVALEKALLADKDLGSDDDEEEEQESEASEEASGDEEDTSDDEEEEQVPDDATEPSARPADHSSDADEATTSDSESTTDSLVEDLRKLKVRRAKKASPQADKSAVAAEKLQAELKKSARRKVLVSASRNAMKSKNAGKRKGEGKPNTKDW